MGARQRSRIAWSVLAASLLVAAVQRWAAVTAEAPRAEGGRSELVGGRQRLGTKHIGPSPLDATDEAPTRTSIARPLTIEAGPVRLRVSRSRVGLRLVTERSASGHSVAERRPRSEVDSSALEGFLATLARHVYTPSVDAVLDFDTPNIHPAQPAVTLDLDGARHAIRHALETNQPYVRVPTTRLPEVRGAVYVPKGLSSAETLGRFETRFERYGEHASRARNVRVASERLHGKVIPAFGTFSFNDAVGPRTPAHGFRNATIIYRGELTEDVGGGVCQAASTLYAAAFLAGLDRVEHRPHSRPSSYIPMGLDATVFWPQTDLVLRNPFPFPVAIRSVIDENTHRVDIIGARRPRQVTFDREWLGTRSFATEVIGSRGGERGDRSVLQRGIRGYTVRVLRSIDEDGRSWTEEATFVYPPVKEIVSVAEQATSNLKRPAALP